jgi:type VI secretion system VgrG family protein
MALEIAALKKTTLHLLEFHGQEAISQTYSFVVRFTSPDIIEGSTVLGQAATLIVTTGGRQLIAAGVVTLFECDDPTPLGDFSYCATIGPHFGLLDLSRQDQVYGTVEPVTLPELISGKLTNKFSEHSTSGGEKVAVEFETRLSGAYAARQNVAQFAESDFNFISRSCENLGVFYFFEHVVGKEKLVFGDSNVAFTSSDPASAATGVKLPFRLTRGVADDQSVASLRAVTRPVTGKFYVRDYNDMQASANLLASASVDSAGIGAMVEYGPNVLNIEEGASLAKVRAEQQLVDKTIFHGVSTCPSLRPGCYFTLIDHPNKALNEKYLVTSVSHQAGDPKSGAGPYSNRFECMRFNVQYRPKQITPRPVAAGLYNATIDSAGPGIRADIDKHGRYKIRQIFDESQSPAGKASAFVREAQPHGGRDDTGFHFPLLKGTEVVIAYINGDPDRPIIVGAVPNSTNPAVSTFDNHLTNRIRTIAGQLIELHDGLASTNTDTQDDNPYLRFVSQDLNTTDFASANYMRLGQNVADESDILISSGQNGATPAVSITDSAVQVTTFNSSQDYLSNSLTGSAEKGQLTTTQLQGNTATANLQKAKVVDATDPSKSPQARTPMTKGVLVYSDGDLQVNAVGGAYMQFQQGHGTVVNNGDSTYSVNKGQYTVFAQNGVSITAGTLPSASETSLLDSDGETAAGDAAGTAAGVNDSAGSDAATQAGIAAGAQTSRSSGLADLYLFASNNVNQKAFGPLSEVTYGDSYKNVQGNTTDIFCGTYYKETHGVLTQHLYADTHNYYHQNTDTITLGGTAACFLGAAISFKLDVELNIVLGLKTDLTMGGAVKLVAGVDLSLLTYAFKFVIDDYKSCITDTKILTTDTKVMLTDSKTGLIDNKQVMIDSKRFVGEIKNGVMDAKLTEIVAESNELKTLLTTLHCIA